MNGLWKILLLLSLLFGSAFAGFIQSPIPLSSRENYLRDSDGNGRLDCVDLKFLGAVSREYLDRMVDSLTFDWLDSAEQIHHYSVGAKIILLDSSSTRRARVDLSSLQQEFALLTELNSGKGLLGNFKMFLSDGTVFDVPVKDKMAPVISETFLKSFRGKQDDTLSITFSEKVTKVYGCEAVLESKKTRTSRRQFLTPIDMLWNESKASAVFVLNNGEIQDNLLLPRDSLRLTPKCFMDSAKNLSEDSAKFHEVSGSFPLEVFTTKLVESEAISEDLPIFQMLFETEGASVPNKNNWGIAVDVLGPEFENAIRDALGYDSKKELDLSKLKIAFKIRIYTNLGDFVVATSDEVYGNDSRFETSPTRLFLKWNLMDATHRRVATGAYISNSFVIISYEGQVVFRNDIHHGSTTQVFGVKRR